LFSRSQLNTADPRSEERDDPRRRNLISSLLINGSKLNRMCQLYAQLLFAVSLTLAGYFDVKERLVSDLLWIPGAVGVVVLFFLLPSEVVPILIRVGLVGAIGLAFARFGFIGEADAIGLVIATADPSILSLVYIMLATGIVALSHIAALYFMGFVGKSRLIPLEQFRAEARWIPKAIVIGGVSNEVDSNVNISREEVEANAPPGSMIEVQYGVPTVAYIAVGYLIYLGYTLLFNYYAFVTTG
jgi:Flp pilus assembly protein protease CpaA